MQQVVHKLNSWTKFFVSFSISIFCKEEYSNYSSKHFQYPGLLMSIMEKAEGQEASKPTTSRPEFLSPEEPTLNPLVLLLRVETLDGNSLPDRFLTVPNCRDLSIECGEEEPY